MTREKVLDHYRTHWCAGNAAIVVAGDITPRAGKTELDKRFGQWRAWAGRRLMEQQVESNPGRVILIERPFAKQGSVLRELP